MSDKEFQTLTMTKLDETQKKTANLRKLKKLFQDMKENFPKETDIKIAQRDSYPKKESNRTSENEERDTRN